jgi:hypothetical protein
MDARRGERQAEGLNWCGFQRPEAVGNEPKMRRIIVGNVARPGGERQIADLKTRAS